MHLGCVLGVTSLRFLLDPVRRFVTPRIVFVRKPGPLSSSGCTALGMALAAVCCSGSVVGVVLPSSAWLSVVLGTVGLDGPVPLLEGSDVGFSVVDSVLLVGWLVVLAGCVVLWSSWGPSRPINDLV